LITLLQIDRPRAHNSADELLEAGAKDDAKLLRPDLDVIHAVAEANATEARTIVDRLRNSAIEGRAEPGLVANYVQKLSFEMHRLVTELNGNPSNVDELQLLWKTEVSRLSLATQFGLLADAASSAANYIGSLSQIRPSARMQQICRDLMKSFKEDITIRDLADRHGISPAYLGQLFRKEYGESFKDYRNRLRIEEAARLLRTTDMRVYEIAQHVGYQSTDYFERRFSSFYGTTPTSYRSEAIEAGSKL
jgi:two-component system response regulator YesN